MSQKYTRFSSRCPYCAELFEVKGPTSSELKGAKATCPNCGKKSLIWEENGDYFLIHIHPDSEDAAPQSDEASAPSPAKPTRTKGTLPKKTIISLAGLAVCAALAFPLYDYINISQIDERKQRNTAGIEKRKSMSSLMEGDCVSAESHYKKYVDQRDGKAQYTLLRALKQCYINSNNQGAATRLTTQVENAARDTGSWEWAILSTDLSSSEIQILYKGTGVTALEAPCNLSEAILPTKLNQPEINSIDFVYPSDAPDGLLAISCRNGRNGKSVSVHRIAYNGDIVKSSLYKGINYAYWEITNNEFWVKFDKKCQSCSRNHIKSEQRWLPSM